MRSPPQLSASALSAYFLRFPRVPVDAGCPWVVSLELNCYHYSTESPPDAPTPVSSWSSPHAVHSMFWRLLVPISFHRSLCPLPSPNVIHLVEDDLRHPYVATVAAGGTALPMIQRGLEPVEQEHAPVGNLPPAPVPEGVDAPSPAIRFLFLLHEELRLSLYILPRDSEGFLIDPLWTITVALRSTDPVASLLSPITQESAIQTHQSIDPNGRDFG